MDAIQKDLESRRDEIKKETELLFKANLKISDWNVPEGNDREAAKILLSIIQEKIDEIKADVEAGNYDYY